MLRNGILPACLFFFINSMAQGFSSAPANLSFQNFTTEDGLSDNYINHIYQDSRGFIWLSTHEGLNRFDGTSFKKFYAGKQKGNSLPSSLVNSVIEYKKNFLLIATQNGMVIMNTVDQQFFTPIDTILASAYASSFLPERNGNIWLTMNDRIVLVDSSLAIQKMIPLDQKMEGFINNIHRLKNGRLIIATTNGYYYIDEEKKSFTPLSYQIRGAGIIKESFFSYYDEFSNSLFASLYHTGLCRIDLDDSSVNTFVPRSGCTNCLQSPVIYSAIRNTQGQLWISSFAGLVLFEEKEGLFLSYTHHPNENASLVNDEVMCLFEDREKNLWVGTQAGLSKLSNSTLMLDYYKKELEINGKAADVFDITKGSDGNIYIATYGNGVFSIKPSTRDIKNFGRKIIVSAWSVSKDGNNIVVTGHQKKMYRLDISSGKTQALTFLRPYQDAGDLMLFAYTDSRGGRWYSINHQQGLFHCKPGASSFTRYSNTQSPAPFPQSYFNSVTEDKKGRLWFGVNKRSELVSYEYNNNRFTVYPLSNKSGLLSQGLTCLFADNNLLWIGTYGTGLIRFEPDTRSMQVFTTEDGLSSNHISSIVKDNKNRLWAGTRKGLSCLMQGQQRFISFTRSDGLPETDFNEGAFYYDSAENRLYAGAGQTLININPDEFLQTTTRAKPLLIDEVMINNKKINFSHLSALQLPYDQNNLQFGFTSIDFENPGSITYYYKLEGADKNWIESGWQHSASYTNLSAGTYRFMVKTTKTGNSSEVVESLPFNIKIRPPWWNTWWFRALVILGLLFFTVQLIRYYVRQKLENQKAIEKERTRIATDMHDDLGAGLSRIKFISQSISNKKIENEAIKNELEKIIIYSDEMSEKMGEIVWALNEKNDTLADLVAYTRSYAVEYLETHNIQCEADTPLHLPGTFITGEMRRNIFLSVKECLHNIVKHAEATRVIFSIQLEGMIKIVIHDNGKGIDWNNQRAFSNGLQNIQQRMKEVNGEVKFLNEGGTKVILTIH